MLQRLEDPLESRLLFSLIDRGRFSFLLPLRGSVSGFTRRTLLRSMDGGKMPKTPLPSVALSFNIRTAAHSDYDDLADVMFDAARNGPSKYTDRQRQAWVPSVRSGQQWEERLAAQTIVVASSSTTIFGFMSLAADSYIDFAYIRPAAQGTGIFRRLYESIEKLARDRGEQRLWVHASLMAERAFTAMGFSITKDETVNIGDQSLRRFEMEKRLDAKIA